MQNKILYIFGSEWFGMVIATLAVSQVFLNINMKTTMKFQTSNPYNNIEINSTVPKFKVISPITLPNDIMDSRLIMIKLETPTGSIAVGNVESDLFET